MGQTNFMVILVHQMVGTGNNLLSTESLSLPFQISLVATIISDINIVDTEAKNIVPLGAGQKVTMNFVVKVKTF